MNGHEAETESETIVADESSHLAQRAVAGVRWGLVSTSSQQILRVVFTIALARMIGPNDFGIAATAAIYVGVTQLFIDSGFGAALVQKEKIDDDDIGSVFWINMLVGAVMVVATLLVAPYVADYFHTPELTSVLRVSSILVVINAFDVVPTAILNRALAWRPMAISQVTGVLIGGVASVIAAAMGARLLVRRDPSDRHRRGRHRHPPRVHGLAADARIVATDPRALGVHVGPHGLAVAALLLREHRQRPRRSVLGNGRPRVLRARVPAAEAPRPPHRASREPGLAARVLAHAETTRSACSVGSSPPAGPWRPASYGPLVLGILVMPDLIPLLFGPKWEPAVLPTQLLTLVSMRQMVLMLIGPLFQALGKTKEQFYWTIVAVAATVTGIVIGLQWGIVGVAAGVTISMYALAPLQIAVARATGRLPRQRVHARTAAGMDRGGRDGRRVDPHSHAVQHDRSAGARCLDRVRSPGPGDLRRSRCGSDSGSSTTRCTKSA